MVCMSVMAYDEVGCRIHAVRVAEHEEQIVPVIRSQKYEKIALQKIPGSPYSMGSKSFVFKSAEYSYRVNIRAKVKYKASSWSLGGDKLEVEAVLYKLPDNMVVAVSTGHSDQVKSPGMLKAMREGDSDSKWSPEDRYYVTVNKSRKSRAFVTLNNPEFYDVIVRTDHPLISEKRVQGGLETASEFMNIAGNNGQTLVSPLMLKFLNIECVIEEK